MIWEFWVFLVLLLIGLFNLPRVLRRQDEENKATEVRNPEYRARAVKVEAETAQRRAKRKEIEQWTAWAEMLTAKFDETTDASERAKLREEIRQCLSQARKHFVRRAGLRDILARSDAAWVRTFAERTGGTVPTSRPLDHGEAGGSSTVAELPNREAMR